MLILWYFYPLIKEISAWFLCLSTSLEPAVHSFKQFSNLSINPSTFSSFSCIWKFITQDFLHIFSIFISSLLSQYYSSVILVKITLNISQTHSVFKSNLFSIINEYSTSWSNLLEIEGEKLHAYSNDNASQTFHITSDERKLFWITQKETLTLITGWLWRRDWCKIPTIQGKMQIMGRGDELKVRIGQQWNSWASKSSWRLVLNKLRWLEIQY